MPSLCFWIDRNFANVCLANFVARPYLKCRGRTVHSINFLRMSHAKKLAYVSIAQVSLANLTEQVDGLMVPGHDGLLLNAHGQDLIHSFHTGLWSSPITIIKHHAHSALFTRRPGHGTRIYRARTVLR